MYSWCKGMVFHPEQTSDNIAGGANSLMKQVGDIRGEGLLSTFPKWGLFETHLWFALSVAMGETLGLFAFPIIPSPYSVVIIDCLY